MKEHIRDDLMVSVVTTRNCACMPNPALAPFSSMLECHILAFIEGMYLVVVLCQTERCDRGTTDVEGRKRGRRGR